MNAEQIDNVLRGAQAETKDGTRAQRWDALRSLADLSVSVLRMIDQRRERGIVFEDSYNEQELRRALASMADQKFPPGPPMELRQWDRVIDAARIYGHGDDGSLDRLAAEISAACMKDRDLYASYKSALGRFGVEESAYHHADDCEYCNGTERRGA